MHSCCTVYAPLELAAISVSFVHAFSANARPLLESCKGVGYVARHRWCVDPKSSIHSHLHRRMTFAV